MTMQASTARLNGEPSGYILPVGEADRNRLDALGELFNPSSMNWLISNCNIQNGTVLDVGCGNGCLTRLIAKTFPSTHVVGVDISEEQIAVSRESASKEMLTNTHWHVCDVFHLDELKTLHPELFDVVHCRFVLSHLPDPLKAVDNMLARLKSGGCLVIEEIGEKFTFQYPSETLKAMEAWKKMAEWTQSVQHSHQKTVGTLLNYFSKSSAISSWGSKLYDISIDGRVKKSFFRMGAEHAVKKIEQLKVPEKIQDFGYQESATWLQELAEFESNDSLAVVGKNFEWIIAQKK
jgi:2-polyprenyl-3-methyl-5-hydroxy-6-metoxy-1,4-benzoquinol methylase